MLFPAVPHSGCQHNLADDYSLDRRCVVRCEMIIRSLERTIMGQLTIDDLGDRNGRSSPSGAASLASRSCPRTFTIAHITSDS